MSLILKQVSYVQVNQGWQTYVFELNFRPIPYKFLANQRELEQAIHKCQQAGWTITNASNLLQKMNQKCQR
jgi:DNA-binding transcriptional regulator YhcF (GntR family)